MIYSGETNDSAMEITAWYGSLDPEKGTAYASSDEKACTRLLSPEAARDYPPVQPELRALAISSGLFSDDRDYNLRLHDAAIALVERMISEGMGKEQDLLMAMQALDGMSQAINLLDERLYEWSRLHSQRIVHGHDLAEWLKDDHEMGGLANSILGLRASRKEMEAEVSRSVQSLAPNISLLAGPVLAARLISRAGGLLRLASMPSSRVQVLGAEKSLFKHLNGHAPSPKHGIIYRHPAVIGSQRRLRGRVARALAGKLSIAARLDGNGAGLTPELQASLQTRLDAIKRRGRKERGRAG